MLDVKLKFRNQEYQVTADTNCYTVHTIKIAEKGKNKGEKYSAEQRYVSSIESVIETIMEQSIRRSDATTLNDILDVVRKVRDIVKKELTGGNDE